MLRKIAFLLSILIGIGIGFVAGFFVAKKTTSNPELVKKTLIEELRGKLNSKIEKQLIFSLVGFPQKRIPAKAFSGEITKIEGDIIEVKVKNFYSGGDLFEFLDQPDFYIKRIKMNENTKIVERTVKEIGELKKPFLSPITFSEKEISKEELKEGISIAVEAKSEFKLEEDKIIEAEKIILTKLES